jgi:hypothetical protein
MISNTNVKQTLIECLTMTPYERHALKVIREQLAEVKALLDKK